MSVLHGQVETGQMVHFDVHVCWQQLRSSQLLTAFDHHSWDVEGERKRKRGGDGEKNQNQTLQAIDGISDG